MRWIFYFLIPAYTLSSCITLVQVPLTEPPEIILPEGAHKISFVSRFDTTQISFTKEKVTEVYLDGYKSFIEGLKDGFETIDHLSLSTPDTLVRGRWYTSSTPSFSDSIQVPSLINQFNANYLLTLDAFNLEREREQEVVDYGGSVVKHTYYYVAGSAALALFDQNAEVIDKMLMNDEVPVDGSFAVSANLGKYGEIAAPLSYDLGYEYALMFVDYEIYVDRYIHSGKPFKEVIPLLQKGQWKQSKKELLPLTQSEDTKIARQAAQNMGVVEEALGNRPEAIKWYKKAQSQRL